MLPAAVHMYRAKGQRVVVKDRETLARVISLSLTAFEEGRKRCHVTPALATCCRLTWPQTPKLLRALPPLPVVLVAVV
jgi:hypothetical protein